MTNTPHNLFLSDVQEIDQALYCFKTAHDLNMTSVRNNLFEIIDYKVKLLKEKTIKE